MISQERLRQVLDYNPDTGLFHWKVRTSNRVKVGAVAGTIRKDGYVSICIDGAFYLAHRLVFIFEVGAAPNLIDHVDGDPSNNQRANLREALHTQNMMNSRHRINNTSGYKGVSFDRSRGLWAAYINAHSTRHWLGYFKNKSAAVAAIDNARPLHHKEFARAI